METQEKAVSAQNELFVKMCVMAWETQNERITKLLNTLSDEQLSSETAPGRNRGIYLVGHLTAVSDAMLTLLGWSERLYPQLDAFFVKHPDKSVPGMPSLSLVKEYWNTINTKITNHIKQMQPEDWFARHTAVLDEDFVKEPHRNKLNVLISRTNHTSYHLGQLIYLSKK